MAALERKVIISQSSWIKLRENRILLVLVKELALRWNGKGFPGGRNSLQRNGGNKNCLMVETN